MVEDSTGRLWITTNDFQLIRISGNDVKVFTEKDGLPTRDFSCLVPGSSGDIWACTSTGLAHIADGNVEVHESPTQIVNRPIIGCRASDGKIWVAGGEVLAAWDGSEFTRIRLKSVNGNREMRSLLCRDDGVWVGTGKGLVRFNAGVEKLYTAKDGLADDVILTLAQGRDGSVWVGTRNGFSYTFFQSAFLLASYDLAGLGAEDWRASLRGDVFATRHPAAAPSILSEDGHALTVALSWQHFDWLRLTGEMIAMQSRRHEYLRDGFAGPVADQHMLQFSARVFL